jgi:uncharacterized protein (TIGR03118 family)
MTLGGVIGGEANSHERCLSAITLFRTSPMWFRKLRSQHDPAVRGSVAIAPRRSQKFGPRVVEALEDRALMSMGGHGHHMLSTLHTSFVQTNLVSDGFVPAQFTDLKLKNPWGLVAAPKSSSLPNGSPWWVNDNGTGVSTLYNGNTGQPQSLIVTIPPPKGSPAGTTSAPTGIVFNGNQNEFLVGPKAPAAFIFATEDGTISGWNPQSPAGPNAAVLEVDNSNGGTGAVYKGLALASSGGSDFLYATNFRAGTIDVFDSSFHQVPLGSGAVSGKFTDPHLAHGFAPFGIANINGNLFVTYAKQDADKKDDVAGRGRGFVDKFDTSGHLIQRVATRGSLNAPWGLAVAPSSFGEFSGDLLVGNFGDGRVNAFKPMGNGRFRFDGQLRDAQRHPITIDGLWGLAVGNDGNAGPSSTLFFTAGLNGEMDGLFGTLTASTM